MALQWGTAVRSSRRSAVLHLHLRCTCHHMTRPFALAHPLPCLSQTLTKSCAPRPSLPCSLQGIEHLSLGAVQNGVILLCGLFFYGGWAAAPRIA
jgi:hypothetical protein